MRSLVAEIFHSLSRNSALASIGELVVLRPHDEADRPGSRRGQLDPAFGRAARGLHLKLVAGLQRTRVGTAEAGACVHGEAAEHRLARDAAFDRQIAEGAAARKAEGERFAVRDGHRCLEGDAAASDIGTARRARQCDADRSLARREGRAERADLDAGGEQRIADEAIRRRQRQPIHRAARRQAIALGAMTPAILHRTDGANACDHEPGHEAINSATISPASAARSCSAKVLASIGEEGDAIAGFQEKDRLAVQLIGPHRSSPEQMPAARAGEALHAGLHATDRDRAGRRQQARILPPRHVQEWLQPAEIGPARRKADHGDPVVAGDVPGHDVVGRRAQCLRDVLEIDAILAAIGDREAPVPRLCEPQEPAVPPARAVARRAPRNRSGRDHNAPAASDRSARVSVTPAMGLSASARSSASTRRLAVIVDMTAEFHRDGAVATRQKAGRGWDRDHGFIAHRA